MLRKEGALKGLWFRLHRFENLKTGNSVGVCETVARVKENIYPSLVTSCGHPLGYWHSSVGGRRCPNPGRRYAEESKSDPPESTALTLYSTIPKQAGFRRRLLKKAGPKP